MIDNEPYDAFIITGAQVRAARALLGWSTSELAARAGVGSATISRLETAGLDAKSSRATRHLITLTFEREGIEFVGNAGSADGYGVHLRPVAGR